MPLQQIVVSPFEAAYIGDYGVGTVLARLNCQRSKGATISKSRPGEYEPVLNNSEQSDDVVYKVRMTFFEGDDTVEKLTNGIALTGNTGDAIGDAKYCLFLVHPLYTQKLSYWFPEIRTDKESVIDYKKDGQSLVDVTFIAQHRSVYHSLRVKDTVQTLLTAISTRAPFVYT